MRTYLLFGLVLVSILVTSGCLQNSSSSQELPASLDKEDSDNVETIRITGMDSTQTVSSDKPVSLVVSGMNANVTVQRNSQITSITVSGMNSIVYLPKEQDPTIEVSGLNAEVVRY